MQLEGRGWWVVTQVSVRRFTEKPGGGAGHCTSKERETTLHFGAEAAASLGSNSGFDRAYDSSAQLQPANAVLSSQPSNSETFWRSSATLTASSNQTLRDPDTGPSRAAPHHSTLAARSDWRILERRDNHRSLVAMCWKNGRAAT